MNNNENLIEKLDIGNLSYYAESLGYSLWEKFFSITKCPGMPDGIIHNYKSNENGLRVDGNTMPFFIARVVEQVSIRLYKLEFYNIYYGVKDDDFVDVCYFHKKDEIVPKDFCIFELYSLKNEDKGRKDIFAQLPNGRVYPVSNLVSVWNSPAIQDCRVRLKELNKEILELETLRDNRQYEVNEISIQIDRLSGHKEETEYYIKNNKQIVCDTKKLEKRNTELEAELDVREKEKEKLEEEISEAEKTKSGLDIEIKKTEKKKSRLEKEIDKIDGSIDEKEKIIEEKSIYIDDLSEKINAKKKEIEDLTLIRKYEIVSQKFEYVMHQIKRIRNYGLGFWEEESPVDRVKKNKIKEFSKDSMKDLIEHIKKYVSSQSFRYGDRVIECFTEAMFTNQLIILYGPTGTGKTSLPALVSKALGADDRHRLVSVQSNWSDEQDLMGFYNAMEKRYIPTDFLDAIVDASKDPENLYFIVLDEMNLAQVEYYFAKILSAMESDDRRITLYSKKDCENARDRIIFKIEHMFRSYFEGGKDMSEDEELKTIREKLEKETEYDPAKFDSYFELCEEWDNLNRYPAEIELPKNIQFIGTINMDASTKNISPKVIDRSFMIEITNGDAGDDLDSDAQMIEPCLLTVESLKKLRSRNTEIDESEIINAINGYVNDLNDNKSTFKVEFSKRSEARVKEMMKGIDADQSHLVEDDILIGKILPAIRCTGEIGSAPQIKNGRMNDKLEKMYDHDFKTLNYWRE